MLSKKYESTINQLLIDKANANKYDRSFENYNNFQMELSYGKRRT